LEPISGSMQKTIEGRSLLAIFKVNSMLKKAEQNILKSVFSHQENPQMPSHHRVVILKWVNRVNSIFKV
jgi:hypothetical protein